MDQFEGADELKPNASGIAFDPRKKFIPGSARELMAIFTWHNVSVSNKENFRVWVASSAPDASYRGIYSIQVEALGEVFRPISELEVTARYALLAASGGSRSRQVLTANAVRGVITGKLLEQHSRALSNFMMGDRQMILTAAEHRNYMKSVNTKKPFKNLKTPDIEIRGTRSHAILIAAIYSTLADMSGSKLLVKRTSEALGAQSDVIYTGVRIARLEGWLSTSGKGVSGGTLTAAGWKALKDLKMQTTFEDIVGKGLEGK